MIIETHTKSKAILIFCIKEDDFCCVIKRIINFENDADDDDSAAVVVDTANDYHRVLQGI